MNFFPFHIGDYAAHTQRLSLMEDLAYRRLMDAYYLAERPLNGSASDVAREIGMAEHLESVSYVLGRFFKAVDGSFLNERCDEEIAHYKDKKNHASNAGKASAAKRFNVRSTSVGKKPTSVGETPTGVQPPHEPITSNHSSVPIGTDGDAVKSPEELTKIELWAAGKSLLAEQGMPKAQCGSFVGKLVKDHGDTIVVDAVRAACVVRPADAAEYLKAACLTASGRRRPVNKQEALEQRGQRVVDEWVAQGAKNAAA